MLSQSLKSLKVAHNHFWATVCKTVRPTLSDRCVFCLYCLSVPSVTFVYCGQTVGWMHGDRPRLWPHCVRWNPVTPAPNGHSPQFVVHACCGQTGGWIKMPLGRKVGLAQATLC